jgi:uncharacterized lipoprotein YajG
MKRTLITLTGLIAAGLLAGCASKPETEKKDKPVAAKQQQQEEYVSQTSLGSWIPKKVKKSEAKTSDQESADSQAAMKELTERGNPRRPTGN